MRVTFASLKPISRTSVSSPEGLRRRRMCVIHVLGVRIASVDRSESRSGYGGATPVRREVARPLDSTAGLQRSTVISKRVARRSQRWFGHPGEARKGVGFRASFFPVVDHGNRFEPV